MQTDTDIQTGPIKTGEPIRKSNMYKFVKLLHAQAQSVFSLFVKSPKSAVWITMDRGTNETISMSFSEFIASINRLPKYPACYGLYFRTYFFKDEPSVNAGLFEVIYRESLNVESVKREFPHFLAYICREAILADKPFVLDDAAIRYYKPLHKYVHALQQQIQYCNKRVYAELDDVSKACDMTSIVSDLQSASIRKHRVRIIRKHVIGVPIYEKQVITK